MIQLNFRPGLTTLSTLNMIDYLAKEKNQDIVKEQYIYNDPGNREPSMYYLKKYNPE